MKKYKSEVILGIIAIVLVIIFIIFIFIARNSIEQYSTSQTEKIYYYIDDELMEYDGKLTLDKNKKITDFYNSEIDLDTLTDPIYFKNEDKVLFPVSMSVVRPTLGMKQNRIQYFSTISKTQTYTKVSNVNLDMNISNAFLYDGVDTYFFVDDVTLTLGKKTIELPAFSYVRCGFKSFVYVYDFEAKTMSKYTDIDYLVYASNNNYRINLSADNIDYNDTSILLMKKINNLPILK